MELGAHTHTHTDGHIFGTVVPGQARSGPPRELLTASQTRHQQQTQLNRTVYSVFALPGYDIILDGGEVDLRFRAVHSSFTPSMNDMVKKLKVNKQTADKKQSASAEINQDRRWRGYSFTAST